ncbi:MAG: hypothetical protein BGO31_03370 [Bacteroidetes bacterium 43-16]|nr:MAG: hypothetical protein BGO31_03370 [Bacteroidetes bacterium 43-16]
MTKRKAKRLLKQQISTFSTCDHKGNHFFKTLSITESIFGSKSVEYRTLSQMINSLDHPNYEKSTTRFLQNLIEIIEVKGIQKNGNFLSRMSEGWLIACITIIVPIIFGLGYWVKSVEKSVEQQQTKEEIIKQQIK